MMKHFQKIIVLSVFAVAFLFFTSKILASEGTIELESLTNEPTRCFATSLRMQNQEYRILFSCRYLIYPVDESIFNYVMWATPINSDKSIKLGVLGLGKGELKTKTPFESLFVTTEIKKDTKTPTGVVVMQGDVQPIEFLEEVPEPSPTVAESDQEQTEEEIQEPEQTQPELTTREKLVLALKRAGIAALFALVALIGIVFVVSRSRG